MAKLKLKVTRAKHLNLSTKKMGFVGRVVTNGTAYYEDIAVEAGENTTLHKAEMKLGIELFIEEAAKMLKQGYIVDMGPLGKLYPSCTSVWVEKAEDLQLSDIKPSLYYRPADEIASAIRTASLVWAKGDKEGLAKGDKEGQHSTDGEPQTGSSVTTVPGGDE